MDNYYNDKYNLDNYSSVREVPQYNREHRENRKNTSRVKSEPKRFDKKNKKTKSPKQNKKSAKVWVFIVITILLVLALCGIVGLVVWSNRDFSFVFSENVSVSGIDISGLSYKQAEKKVKSKTASVVEEFSINITAFDVEKTLNEKDFSYKFNVKKALDEAKLYSLKEQDKYEETSSTEFETLANPDFKLEYNVEKKSITKNVSKISKEVNREYTNARVKEFKPFAADRFIYEEGSNGYQLVEEDLKQQITDFFDTDEKEINIEASVNVFEPKITVADLKRNIVGLSQATSISYNTANGNTNMRVALEACNGSVIEPGEVWSFNDCTGDSNLESNGYKPATVISQQKLTEGVGGGLCQASTTIFKAAIFANMSIYERHNHFWASAYAYPGEDATIDYPNLDLKLSNPTSYQMFIECKMEGTTLLVNIYGYQEPSYDNIKIYSENHDIEKGKSYKTTTYRVLYLNGKIVKEEVLCNSVYSLKDNASVKAPDKGTFRTTVSGETQEETEPPTEKTTEKPTEKPTEKQTEETREPATERPSATIKPTQKPTIEPTEKPTEATTTATEETETSEETKPVTSESKPMH